MKTYRGKSGQKWYEIDRTETSILLIPEYCGGPYPSYAQVDTEHGISTIKNFTYLGEEKPPPEIAKLASKILGWIAGGKLAGGKPNALTRPNQ